MNLPTFPVISLLEAGNGDAKEEADKDPDGKKTAGRGTSEPGDCFITGFTTKNAFYCEVS